MGWASSRWRNHPLHYFADCDFQGVITGVMLAFAREFAGETASAAVHRFWQSVLELEARSAYRRAAACRSLPTQSRRLMNGIAKPGQVPWSSLCSLWRP